MNRHRKNKTSPCSDEEVLEIRTRQFQGEPKKEVMTDYPNLTYRTFSNVWDGITKSQIVPRIK